MSKRQRIQPTDDWQQLSLLIDFPEQLTYEVLRPVVLFGYSPGKRAKETGVAQRTRVCAPSAPRIPRRSSAALH